MSDSPEVLSCPSVGERVCVCIQAHMFLNAHECVCPVLCICPLSICSSTGPNQSSPPLPEDSLADRLLLCCVF